MVTSSVAFKITRPVHTVNNEADPATDFGIWLDGIAGQTVGVSSTHYWVNPSQAKRVEAAIFDPARLTLLTRRASERLQALGVRDRRLVPPNIGLPMLEAATAEYDDGLHALWANLLASALNPDQDVVDRQFVSILTDLSSEHARTLAVLYALQLKGDRKPLQHLTARPSPAVDVPAVEPAAFPALRRLGLIELEVAAPSGNLPPTVLTLLGMSFCHAVGLSGSPHS